MGGDREYPLTHSLQWNFASRQCVVGFSAARDSPTFVLPLSLADWAWYSQSHCSQPYSAKLRRFMTTRDTFLPLLVSSSTTEAFTYIHRVLVMDRFIGRSSV